LWTYLWSTLNQDYELTKGNYIITFVYVHRRISNLLQRQKIASAIISSKISDTDDNDTKVDLGDEKIELIIDIGMVFVLLHNCI